MTIDSAPFADLAVVADAVRATSKRLEKMALLGAYFAGLDDDDLARACRFLAGRPFPAHDERTLNVGGAAVVAVLCDLAGMPPEEYGALHVRTGDIGDVAARDLAARAGRARPAADAGRGGDGLRRDRGHGGQYRHGAARLRALLARAGAARGEIPDQDLHRRDADRGQGEPDRGGAGAGRPGCRWPRCRRRICCWAISARWPCGCATGSWTDVGLALFHPLKSMLASPTDRASAELLAAAGDTDTPVHRG